MKCEDLGRRQLGGVHLACAYADSVVGLLLTALTHVTSAFCLGSLGLWPVGLVAIPIAETLT